MASGKTTLTRLALDTLYYTRGYRLIPSAWGGMGIIFTLHHVCPPDLSGFTPNGILEISPQFLDRAISLVRDAGLEIITLDEVAARLTANDQTRRFACFTLDDGYVDNYEHAMPVFERHAAPFHIYVTTGLPDGTAVLWWRLLELVIRNNSDVTMRFDSDSISLQTISTKQKWQAWNRFYWTLRGQPQDKIRETINRLIEDYQLDFAEISRNAAMNWDMITELAHSKLATIGAHTRSHYFLSKLSDSELLDEIDSGRRTINERTGKDPVHFAYPYGDRGSAGPREFDAVRDLGFKTATTTRKGVLFSDHGSHLHALPRVSLNGDYQTERYVRLFLSGAPFALAGRFRRLDVS